MLKIRLKRAGARNHPFYRVVVMDSRKARDSRALEEIGYYNPLEEPMVINVNREKVAYWTERGAQISDSVKGLLTRENNLHPVRRNLETFDPEPPEEKAPPKPKKKKTAKAASGVKKAKDTEVAAKAKATAETKDGSPKEAAKAPKKEAKAKTEEAKTEVVEAAPATGKAAEAEAVPEAVEVKPEAKAKE